MFKYLAVAIVTGSISACGPADDQNSTVRPGLYAVEITGAYPALILRLESPDHRQICVSPSQASAIAEKPFLGVITKFDDCLWQASGRLAGQFKCIRSDYGGNVLDVVTYKIVMPSSEAPDHFRVDANVEINAHGARNNYNSTLFVEGRRIGSC